MFERFLHELPHRHGRRVEAHSRSPLAFDLALDPHEDLGVDRLRTGIAAPQPAGDRGKQKQRVGTDDEERGEKNEVLWPEDEAEDIELPRGKVEQDGLASVPGKPRQSVEHELREDDKRDAPAREPAVHRAWVDLPADLVERYFLVRPRTDLDWIQGNRWMSGTQVHCVISRYACHVA
jgi:hypothetical protein